MAKNQQGPVSGSQFLVLILFDVCVFEKQRRSILTAKIEGIPWPPHALASHNL